MQNDHLGLEIWSVHYVMDRKLTNCRARTDLVIQKVLLGTSYLLNSKNLELEELASALVTVDSVLM